MTLLRSTSFGVPDDARFNFFERGELHVLGVEVAYRSGFAPAEREDENLDFCPIRDCKLVGRDHFLVSDSNR